MCRWADATSIQTAAKWWEAAVEVITRELWINGECCVPLLGKFDTREVKETWQNQVDENGVKHTYKVPGRYVPFLRPSDDFINDINMQGVTKSYRKRLKKGALSQRDWQREMRAQSMQAKPITQEEKMEILKAQSVSAELKKLQESINSDETYKELLKEKVKKIKGKVWNDEEEE